MLFKISPLKNFANFTEKKPVLESLFDKFARQLFHRTPLAAGSQPKHPNIAIINKRIKQPRN